MIHDNSRESHEDHESSGKGSTYRKKIQDLLRETGVPMTDRQIINILNVLDVNNIRPEITRLKQAGILEECGKVKCPVTKKTVRLVRIKPPPIMDYPNKNQMRLF